MSIKEHGINEFWYLKKMFHVLLKNRKRNKGL